MELDSIVDLANPSSTSMGFSYQELMNLGSMSTSGQICSCVWAVWTIICRWKMFQKA